jgi:23S rRNA (guanosine2251-2'-O)-methyltransferase
LSSRGRARTDDDAVPGERAVRELLEHAPARIDRVLVSTRAKLEALEADVRAAGLRVERVDPGELQRRLPGIDHRGVIAIARPRPMLDVEDLLPGEVPPDGEPARRLWLALDGVLDPQNLGAILRSAEFFGVEGVVWPKDRAASVTPAVVRASAGASERLPLSQVTNLARAIASFQEAGVWVVGTVPEGGKPLRELARPGELPGRLLVVMGSEEKGMRRLTTEACDFLVTIPRRGAVASLNVAAATAVLLSALA